MKKLFLTMIAAVLTITAQAQLREDAFIIRTTDGAAQGLLFGDVEKITFSNLDDDGVPHTGIYYQELHYPDTIVRVPVTDIAEVSFEKPSVKFLSNVVNLAESQELLKWIYRCEETESGHKLTIAPNVSSSLLPEVNQMLIYFEGKNDVFDGVFAGRVKSINKTSQGYEVETERPEGIQDIYEELIGVEAVTDNTPGVRECLRKANALPKEAPVTRVDGGTSYSIPFDLNLSYDFLDDGDLPEWGPNGALLKGKAFSLSGGIRGTLGIRLAYEFSKERNFLSIGTDYEYTPYFNMSFAANATWIKPFYEPIAYPIINIPIPSAPIFTLSVGGAPFISLSGSASVKLDKTLPTTKVHNLAYYLDGEYRSSKSDMSEKGAANKGDLSLIDLPMKVTAPKPDGTWLLPVKYGYAIYRENGSFIESKYSDNYYFSWKGLEDDPAEAEAILGETKQWIPGQKYKLNPAFKLLGFDRKEYEFRAEPARNETPAEDAKVHTGDYEIVYDPIEPYALLYGSLDEEIIMSPRFASCNFEYTTDPNFGENSWHNLNAVKGKGDKQTQYKSTERLNGLKTSTTYYYRLRADYFDVGEHTYGEIKSFKTPESFNEEE